MNTPKGPRQLYLLGFATLAAVASIVVAQKYLNNWTRDFYDAISKKDTAGFPTLLGRYTFLSLAFVSGSAALVWIQGKAVVIIREHLFAPLVRAMYAYPTLAVLRASPGFPENPDQRICDDTRLIAQNGVEILTNGLRETAISFVFGAVLLVPAAANQGGAILTASAIFYAVVSAFCIHLAGKALISLNFERETCEADLRSKARADFVRARDISIEHGWTAETKNIQAKLQTWAVVFQRIIRLNARVALFSLSLDKASTIIPITLLFPYYANGGMDLGSLMQRASAFGQICGAVYYLMSCYPKLTEMAAAWRRLAELKMNISVAETRRDAPTAGGLVVPTGRVLCRYSDLPSELPNRCVITAPSGAGKSTLAQAIAGLWPFSERPIFKGLGERVELITSNPFLPNDTLAAVLSYPNPVMPEDWSSDLKLVGLPHLIGLLGESGNWEERLSLGERQRIALIRAVKRNPSSLILDEGTSHLDHAALSATLEYIETASPGMTLIVITHSADRFPDSYHEIPLDGVFRPPEM